MNTKISRSLPYLLSAFLIAADQYSKILIVKHIPLNTIGYSFLGDFLRIVHVRNTGAAFSLGDNLSNSLRIIFIIIVPLIVMLVLAVYLYRTKSLTRIQQWCLSGILGGGIGNLIDRIFRAEGVVDFVDVKFYGLFGLNRFPVFNVADSAVVVFGIIILITFLLEGRQKDEQKV